MAATFGSIGEYEEGKEDWPQYVERLEHFFAANGIVEDDRKLSVFLSVIGPNAYKLLRSVISPKKPGEKTFEELVTAMTEHHSPAPSEIVQRYKFHSRFRKPGESIATFVSELRSLAEFCNFEGNQLENQLRDRLVCGVNDDQIQRRLLSEAKLTYKRALELAQGLETAAKNVRELQTSSRVPSGPTADSTMGAVHRLRPAPRKKVPDSVCYRCGKPGHFAAKCRFKDAKCHNCGKVGHLRKVCRSKRTNPATGPHDQQQQRTVKHLEAEQLSPEEEEYSLFQMKTPQSNKPFQVEMVIEGHSLSMEIDTGAAFSLVAEDVYRQNWGDKSLTESKVNLRTYSGEQIAVLGCLQVNVEYNGQKAIVPLLVVRGSGPSLLGRDWLSYFKLDWKSINLLQGSSLDHVLQRHKAVFQDGLGKLQGYQAAIQVDPDAQPRFCKARSVPYAMKEMVEKELDRLVEEGTVESVQFSDWAAPIVPVLKADKSSVRICGDFSLTVNQVSKLDRYPIPKVEDLLASLAGGKAFTKLDLSQAYQQVPLDEASKKYVVINTQKGLYQFNRLPYGVSSAPGIFQRIMDSLLADIPGVVVYMDDILVTGPTESDHLAALEEVLSRLEKAGLRLRKTKCQFMVSSVTYLGYTVDSEGLHPTPEKVRAITEAPSPRNVTELKSYLGLLSYYSRFLPKISTILAPLYLLLRHDTPWHWKAKQQAAFLESKQLLTSSRLLIHFNPKFEIVLACDASSYGIGAVLAHRLPDGTEKPIAFASRSLSSAEKNYSQIEKEGLACVFGVKRFHSYLFGHHFTLYTDHKPLLTLFSEHQAVSSQASARIQRWALTLAMYEYTLVFRSTTDHSNADAMSRLPLPEKPDHTPIPVELVLLAETLEEAPITATHIRLWTRRNPVLSQVLQCIQSGWPASCSQDLKPFWFRRTELSVQDGCILWGSRIVIPEPGRERILQELHDGHPGISRMKSLARSFMWWPNMDQEIERMVKSCTECQVHCSAPPVAPLHPWKWPTHPWSRLHLDFAGPFLNNMFLILVDSHSKWLEVFQMSSTTSTAVIQRLRTVFAQFGLPATIVTDNGSNFTSLEFKEFLQRNGIAHVTSSPYHPASNGLAERAVKTFKQGMRKIKQGTLSERMARFLFNYRITPQTTTGLSPAELLQGRRLRSRLDLLKPDIAARVQQKQLKQKESHDRHARARCFEVGDTVFTRNFGKGDDWLPARIVERTGPVSFRVELEHEGLIWRRHQDLIRKRHVEELPFPPVELEIPEDDSPESEPEVIPTAEVTPATQPENPDLNVPTPTGRYPKRVRRPPERYQAGQTS